MEAIKVFVSYAWTSQDYESWVLSLAERLVSDGIDVVIDRWDLEPGQDKIVFMEKLVLDPSIQHVLMLLNELYKTKADTRTGGVGTEAQIIGAELYEKTDQTKFIPIIAERDSEGKEFSPVFLKNRIYVDLSDNERFEAEYEKLLRAIYKRPQYSKPKIGTAPSYLFEEHQNFSDLASKEKPLLAALERNDRSIAARINEYLTVFDVHISEFRLENPPQDSQGLGKLTFERFLEMTLVRDSYLRVNRQFGLYGELRHYERFFQYFASIEKFTKPEKARSSWLRGEFDHFGLFFYELTISALATFMTLDRVDLVKAFLSGVLLKDSQQGGYYESFDKRLESIYDKFLPIEHIGAHYSEMTGRNLYEPLVEIIKGRVSNDLKFGDLIEADLLLHYYRLKDEQKSQRFPSFAIYLSESNLVFFSKLIFREKISDFFKIFDVADKSELLKSVAGDHFGYDRIYLGGREKLPKMAQLVPHELWGTK